MYNNEKILLRLPSELLEYCDKKSENRSKFIREAIREKITRDFKDDTQNNFVEIKIKSIYTFYAKLNKVIDGDTLIVDADLGFFTTVHSKIRLSGINAPALKTPKGKKAMAFLEKELQNANLVLETRKKEKYGRFLANIYYHNEYTSFEDIVSL